MKASRWIRLSNSFFYYCKNNVVYLFSSKREIAIMSHLSTSLSKLRQKWVRTIKSEDDQNKWCRLVYCSS